MSKEDWTQITALVPPEKKDAAMAKTKHGEISRKVRELIEAIAESEDGDLPDVSDVRPARSYTEELEEREDYPNDWQERREEVFRRDNYICQNCGDRGGRDGHATLSPHHIVPAENGGTHYLSNLVTLCTDCHDLVHRPE